jgi:hypothetical protein
MADRAVVFIDGNNWYHSIKDAGVEDLGRLDYRKISQKLLGPREWTATRYYIGQVPQTGDTSLYSAQRRFLALLQATDGRISTHLGRLEERPVDDPAASELLRYLATLQIRIERSVYHDRTATSPPPSAPFVISDSRRTQRHLQRERNLPGL